jgi:hypothetical protein
MWLGKSYLWAMDHSEIGKFLFGMVSNILFTNSSTNVLLATIIFIPLKVQKHFMIGNEKNLV